MIIKTRQILLMAILLSSGLLVGCGKAKFAANSEKNGGTSEEQIDHPTDVAGGLGLTCVESDNQSDKTKSDFSCTFRDKEGRKFNGRHDISLVLSVKIGDTLVDVAIQPADSDSNFRFTVAKSVISQVVIDAKFENPQSGGVILVDKSTELIPVIVDKIPPKNPTILINNDDEYTADNLVDLTFSASDAPTHLYVTNTAGCSTGGSWQNYTTKVRGWALKPEQLNESASVFVKFKDASGNESSCVSDSIIHDNTAPSVTISSPSLFSTTTNPINLSINFSEAVTGFTISDIRVSNGTLSDFVELSTSMDEYFVKLTPMTYGAVTVDITTGAAQDRAGNLSTAAAQLAKVFSSSQSSALPSCVQGDVDGGNSVSQVNSYIIHKFTAVGSSSLTVNRACKMEILIVAGGGGGGTGADGAGGGGAGGLLYRDDFGFEQSGTYAVTVGRGGLSGSNGENSSVGSIIAIGGGKGANRDKPKDAGTGGSGGGAAHTDNCPSGEGTLGQGYNGGCSRVGNYPAGGGGGGAGGPGGKGSGSTRAKGGNGGVGLRLDISGNAVYYAGGGGGNGTHGIGIGGQGGGGNGGLFTGNGTAGAPNTGGGGGSGSAGGSGIVIIRYPVTSSD